MVLGLIAPEAGQINRGCAMKEVTEIPEKTDSKEEEIFNNFGKGICCAAQVFGALAPYCGIDPDQARKIASCFGSGMTCGGTCGCVTGALMAIGCKYGNFKPDQMDQRAVLFDKRKEFLQKFVRRFGSCNCPELLMDYDPCNPQDLEVIKSRKLMLKVCAPMVIAAIETGRSILEE